jgi:hypothetical protein
VKIYSLLIFIFSLTFKTKNMENRLSAAHRRKELAERRERYERSTNATLKELHHEDVNHRRQAIAAQGDNSKAPEYEKYYSASGPGSAWRHREGVELKNSPRNLRRGVYLDDKDDPKKNKDQRKVMKKISPQLYERLSFQRTKQSSAEMDEHGFYF